MLRVAVRRRGTRLGRSGYTARSRIVAWPAFSAVSVGEEGVVALPFPRSQPTLSVSRQDAAGEICNVGAAREAKGCTGFYLVDDDGNDLNERLHRYEGTSKLRS